MELYKKAEKALSKDLDIVMILRSLQEFERLKKILLDEEQQILLNYTPKCIISLKDGESVEKSFRSLSLFQLFPAKKEPSLKNIIRR
jgi:hypothetical protein